MLRHFYTYGDDIKRARKAGVAYEPIDRGKVFERDGWICQLCGELTPRELIGTNDKREPTLDHRIAMANDGPHLYGNVQCACRGCNERKRNTDHVMNEPEEHVPERPLLCGPVPI